MSSLGAPQNPLLFEYSARAVERIAIILPRFERLHPSLDYTVHAVRLGVPKQGKKVHALKRHSTVDGYDARCCSDTKGDGHR